MCGRYMLNADVGEILQYYGIIKGWTAGSWAPEVFPSHKVPIVLKQKEYELVSMKWGFDVPNGKGLIINSRGETVDSRPMFRRAFRQKRCIVPATGFFEWAKMGRDKTKYQFSLKSSVLFSMAGICEDFQDSQGNPYQAFTILTTQPNSMVSLVHDRMPVLISKEDEEYWLNNRLEDISLLKALIRPYDDSEMEVDKA